MLKWTLVGLAILVALLLGALLAVPLLLDTPAIQAYVSHAVSQALGRPVRFTALSISALPLPTVKLRGLQVGEDPRFGPGPFVTVREGRIRIRIGPLLQGRVELADLTLKEPRIRVVEDAAGRLNVATLGGAAPASGGTARAPAARPGVAAAGAMLLSRVRVVNGAVDYQKTGAPRAALTLDDIDVTVTQAAASEPLRVRGSAQGQPGNVRLTISEATVSVAPGRAFGDAHIQATVDVEARDVAPAAALLVPSPGVSGPLKGRVQVSGTPARLTASGAVGFDRLTLTAQQPRCPPPKRRSLSLEDVRGPLVYAPPRLESEAVQAKVAKGTVAFRLSVALGPPQVATLRDIVVKGMQLEPVLVDYLCQQNAVTGPLDLTGEASLRLPGALPTLNGSGRLQIGAGRVIGPDLLDALSQALALTDLVSSALDRGQRSGRPGAGSALNFDSITATYTITNGVARTEDLVYVARDLRLTGVGSYGLVDGRTAMDVVVTQGGNRVKARVAGGPGALTIVPTDVRIKDSKDLRKALDRLLR
ncbi:MAG TPA: AsmA-like C-terminal region-containing protein [Methylomirabilota bacterium]|nr:AsmA-like C-terminal region-containing protein [Methylomirabilota bacterium]